MDYLLEIISIIGIIYTSIALIESLIKFRKFYTFYVEALPFIVFALLSFVILFFINYFENLFAIFTGAELLYLIFIYKNYLKTNFAYGLVILAYFEDVFTILSIYFSFYITASLISNISNKKSSPVILASFIFMDVSLVLDAFYILQDYSIFQYSSIMLFFLSVILFLYPFVFGLRRME